MSLNICYNSILINTMSTSSAVTIGESILPNWKAPNNNNFGTGNYFGINYTSGTLSSIFDNDCFDFPLAEADVTGLGQFQSL